MLPWNELLLGAYYLSTLGKRHRAAAARIAHFQEPVRILFYHRVADTHPNEWTIDSNTFARQVDWLRERFDIVSLAEAQRRIASGKNRWPTACITFDDGYADNCESAIPLLLRNDLPFTYFVATDYVLQGQPFPHDMAAGERLKPNTVAELKSLAQAGVEIGAHTRTHADLGRLPSDEHLEAEIAGSKHELEQALGIEVRYFAFPYGLPENLTTAAFRFAYQAGFAGVCSAFGGYNFPGDDAFHLRRFHGDPRMVRFKNWLTVDPRKLATSDAFQPGEYRDGSTCSEADEPTDSGARPQKAPAGKSP